jgi:hypothetical protein
MLLCLHWVAASVLLRRTFFYKALQADIEQKISWWYIAGIANYVTSVTAPRGFPSGQWRQRSTYMFTSRFASLPVRSARLALGAFAFAMCAWSGLAQAAEAGRIVLVHGLAQVANRTLSVGDAVAEGDEIATGKDGYVYLRTVDNGLLILRPSSRARIVTYHVDRQNPANTRIKLELLSGVARSVSGDAVKLARQNFRFNTPVAAIGVRGTDFTVYTDQQTSRVTVLSGGIVVSGFGGACAPEGGGPCEHGTSRELSATQVGQMLQVARGHAVPQLMAASPSLAPDAVSPPRADEPLAKASATSTAPASAADVSLDPKKAESILQGGGALVVTPPVVTIPPPVVTVPDPVQPPPVPVIPPEPDSRLVWGRWAVVLGQPAAINNAQQLADKAERVAQDTTFSIFRTAGAAWAPPEQGSMGFALKQSEAYVRTEATGLTSAARLENGQLNVDFGKATFTTSFDLLTDAERFKLQALGVMTRDGLLIGNSQFSPPTNMNVNGALGPENGTSAAYIFSTRLDEKRIANGVTYWGKQ